MKSYKKPVVISEEVLEKVALSCEDYIYYAKDYEGCMEEYMGRGKATMSCTDGYS